MLRKCHVKTAVFVAGTLVGFGAGCSGSLETRASAAPTASTASPASVTAVFEVRGMDCETCEYAIEEELRKLDGVLEVSASRADAVVLVEIDPGRVEPSTIESRIEKLGYEALLDTRHARDVVRSTGSSS